MAPGLKRATALSALAAPRTALTPVGGNSSDESPLRGGGGALARKLRKSNNVRRLRRLLAPPAAALLADDAGRLAQIGGSQSEPDLNAVRRRRKRGSKKVKKGALGPREEMPRSTCATPSAPLGVYRRATSSSLSTAL